MQIENKKYLRCNVVSRRMLVRSLAVAVMPPLGAMPVLHHAHPRPRLVRVGRRFRQRALGRSFARSTPTPA